MTGVSNVRPLPIEVAARELDIEFGPDIALEVNAWHLTQPS